MYRFLHTRGTHLGTLGVNHDADVGRHGPHVFHDGTDAFLRGMCGVHTNYVHTSEEKLADEVLVTTPVTDRSNYLCLFHILNFTLISNSSAKVQRKSENQQHYRH